MSTPAPSLAPLRDLVPLLHELFVEGGAVIATPLDAGAAEPIAAMTIVQPSGDVIIQVSKAAASDPARLAEVWSRHRREVESRLRVLDDVRAGEARLTRLGTLLGYVVLGALAFWPLVREHLAGGEPWKPLDLVTHGLGITGVASVLARAQVRRLMPAWLLRAGSALVGWGLRRWYRVRGWGEARAAER